ncbi:MAG: RodZ domain-containing protein [Acidimicrobiales bacterium]
MVAIASFSVLGVVALIALWSRFGPRQMQRRSVESHQRALDVLGELAERRHGVAAVHVPEPDEVARPHVRTTDPSVAGRHVATREEIRSRRFASRLVLRSGPTPLRLPIFDDTAPARTNEPAAETQEELAHPAATSPLDASSHKLDEAVLHFDATVDEVVAESGPNEPVFLAPVEPRESIGAEPPSSGAMPESAGLGALPRLTVPRGLRAAASADPLILRKIASAAAVVVVLAAAGVGGWQLATNKPSPHRPAAAPSTPKSHGSTSKSHSSSSKSNPPSVVHEITPASTSRNLVTFPLRVSSFTITFSAKEPCWIGILPSQHGPYLWMTTLGAGTTTTYHATAPVYVRIGAPQYVRVKVDGVRLALPPKMIQPYDVTFTIGSSVSA